MNIKCKNLMKIFLINIKKFIFEYKYIFIGFFIISLYFWNRFFRSRTIKTLPLNFSVLGFAIQLYLCIIYTYIIISLLFPKKINDNLEQIINWLFIPLQEVDKFTRTIPIFKKYYIILISKLDFFIINTNLLYICFWIIPRLILLLALYMDVFIFHTLKYKYYVLYFGLFLLLSRYIKYSLKNYKNELIQESKTYIETILTPYVFGIHPAELDPNYDPNDPDEQEEIEFMALPFEIFIKFQTESIVYQGITRDYESSRVTNKVYEEIWMKYIQEPYKYYSSHKDIPQNYTNIFGNTVPDNYIKATNIVRKKKSEFINSLIKNTLNISLLVEYYNFTSNHNKKIKYLKILIYMNYLLCWLYVLIISMKITNIEELFIILNSTWENIQNPFYD